ncbi:YitT family protein [Microbacter sp. GSS18]|nr:YitT family protein [Microbacter sp. GSS18]
MSTAPTPVGVRHSLLDDMTGLASGVLVASLGLYLLSSGGVVTGGTAGLALLLSYGVPIPFGVLFVAVNIPFFALGVAKRGWAFILRSLACVVAVSLLGPLHHAVLGERTLDPLYAALVGNVLAGVGLLILFRHSASLGGFNIVALIAQERLGWRAGYVQMVLDGAVVLLSLVVVDPLLVLMSAAGAVALNGIIALNHRPGRYMGY